MQKHRVNHEPVLGYFEYFHEIRGSFDVLITHDERVTNNTEHEFSSSLFMFVFTFEYKVLFRGLMNICVLLCNTFATQCGLLCHIANILYIIHHSVEVRVGIGADSIIHNTHEQHELIPIYIFIH